MPDAPVSPPPAGMSPAPAGPSLPPVGPSRPAGDPIVDRRLESRRVERSAAGAPETTGRASVGQPSPRRIRHRGQPTAAPGRAAAPAGVRSPTTPPALGRHARPGRIRTPWEARYVRSLVACGPAGRLVGRWRRLRRPVRQRGHPVQPAVSDLHGLLPLLLLASLTLNRAYERRFLFVGTDEYQRVLRAGLALTAMTGDRLVRASSLGLARGYVALALPLATAVVASAARFALRKQLHRRRAAGRVPAPGDRGRARTCRRRARAPAAAASATTAWRSWAAACRRATTARSGLPVYGTFDDVADAVEAARADTVIVLSCPELDGHTLRRLAWRLERDGHRPDRGELAGRRGRCPHHRPAGRRPADAARRARPAAPARPAAGQGRRSTGSARRSAAGPARRRCCWPSRCGASWTRPGRYSFGRSGSAGTAASSAIFKFRTHVRRRRGAGWPSCGISTSTTACCSRCATIRGSPGSAGGCAGCRWTSCRSCSTCCSGEMSLVGPRPPLPEEVAAYPDDVRRRLAVDPGMTGLWQVSGRSDLSVGRGGSAGPALCGELVLLIGPGDPAAHAVCSRGVSEGFGERTECRDPPRPARRDRRGFARWLADRAGDAAAAAPRGDGLRRPDRAAKRRRQGRRTTCSRTELARWRPADAVLSEEDVARRPEPPRRRAGLDRRPAGRHPRVRRGGPHRLGRARRRSGRRLAGAEPPGRGRGRAAGPAPRRSAPTSRRVPAAAARRGRRHRRAARGSPPAAPGRRRS